MCAEIEFPFCDGSGYKEKEEVRMHHPITSALSTFHPHGASRQEIVFAESLRLHIAAVGT